VIHPVCPGVAAAYGLLGEIRDGGRA